MHIIFNKRNLWAAILLTAFIQLLAVKSVHCHHHCMHSCEQEQHDEHPQPDSEHCVICHFAVQPFLTTPALHLEILYLLVAGIRPANYIRSYTSGINRILSLRAPPRVPNYIYVF